MTASGTDDGVVDLRLLRRAAEALHEVLDSGAGDIIVRQDLNGKLGMPVTFVFEGDNESEGEGSEEEQEGKGESRHLPPLVI